MANTIRQFGLQVMSYPSWLKLFAIAIVFGAITGMPIGGGGGV